jgi:hypothetical protein
MGCSDIFEFIGLDIIDAGRRRSWGQGGSGIGVWVGGRVGGGDDGGRRSELLHQAVFGISPVSCCRLACEEAVEAFGGSGAVEDAVFTPAVEARVVCGLMIE